MSLKVLSGSANLQLAEDIAAKLGGRLTPRVLERFPDGELHIDVQESVRGDDVYIVQPTTPPVDEHLCELLFMADACRRAGAACLTAVVPYFGYARQDRRFRGREPLGARLVADLLSASGLQRVVTVDLHSAAIESGFSIPLEHLSAVPILAEALRPRVSRNTVIVSPDLGAVKIAERYSRLLDLPVAIIHKTRISGEEVKVERIIGEVRGQEALIIDDMISTGGTVEKAIEAVLKAGCLPSGMRVAASHALLVGAAAQRLGALPIDAIYVTDSLPAPKQFPVRLETLSLAALLAEAIQRLHKNESLARIMGR